MKINENTRSSISADSGEGTRTFSERPANKMMRTESYCRRDRNFLGVHAARIRLLAYPFSPPQVPQYFTFPFFSVFRIYTYVRRQRRSDRFSSPLLVSRLSLIRNASRISH